MTTEETSPAPEGEKRTFRGFAWTHAAAIIAALPFVIAGVRVLLYSGGDPVVLKTLIETLNITTLLLGTLLPILPAFVLFFLQALAFGGGLFSRLLASRSGRIALLAVFVFWMLIGPLPTTLWVAGGLVVGGIVRAILLRYVPRFHAGLAEWLSPPAGSKFVSPWLIGIAVTIVFVLAVPQGMWVPLERVSRDGQGDEIVYVLDDAEGWMTTSQQDRSIMLLRSEDVTDRVVCDQGSYSSLITIMTRADPAPRDDCTG
ncbi:hypothetical protein [Agromyces sp. LHK192]|uniref:hypothetical protein n=1 Tax=Agromyces sp. LHK192 TaxID=2498704 RepID=UPI000FD770A2|nr:hypothetical protein [Agromyces sp. LHK192]